MERLTRKCGDEYLQPIYLANSGNGFTTTKDIIKKLAEYEDAEEQGLLYKLPCKVGDTVWDIDIGKPIPYKITGFSLGDIDEEYDIPNTDEIYFYASSTIVDQRFPISDIGETIFLSRESAEGALKGSASE